MSGNSAETSASSTRATKAGVLRRGTIGVWGMVFMVIAATAPLTSMASNFSLSLGLGSGVGTLGWILVIGILLLIFTAGYVALARTVVSAGAYQAYVTYGLGAATGNAVAFIAGIAYNMACAAMIAATGYFTNLAMSSYAGIDIPWWIYSAVALAIVGALGWFGVDVASKLTTVICLCQFALLIALGVAVLIHRPDGFDLSGFTAHEMTSGGFALTIVFVVLSFAGYEAAATYGEEAHAPGRKITVATITALILLAVIFLASTWTLIAAYSDIRTEATLDPGSVLSRAADEYLGPFTGALLSVVTAGSFLAAAVAFHNLSARYTYSLGRDGLLSSRLANTHAVRGTPHVAVSTQLAIDIAVLGPFIVAGADPLSALFPAVSGVTSLALVSMMALCSVSAIVASCRGKLAGSIIATRICPAIAAIALVITGLLIVANYEQVTGSSSPAVMMMPGLLVVGAVAGILMTRHVKQKQRTPAST